MAVNLKDNKSEVESDSIAWILSHKKFLHLALANRAYRLGEINNERYEKIKQSNNFEDLAPSTQLLIENLGESFSRLDRVEMDQFQEKLNQTTLTQETITQESLDQKKTEINAEADLRNFLLESHHKNILDTLQKHRDQLEKNHKKSERWMKWVSDPAEIISSFLHLGEDLPPPINFILKPIRVGFSYISHLAELKAMQYDPDRIGRRRMGQKGALIGVAAATGTLVGVASMLLGGAAVGVALAPISIFLGVSAMCLSNLIATGKSIRNLVKDWKVKEDEKSPWPRRIGMMAHTLSNVAGAAFTAVLAVAAFAAIANPIGLAVAGGLLFTWAAVTAGIGLFSYLAKTIAEKLAKKQKVDPKKEQEKGLSPQATDKPDLIDDKKLGAGLNQVEESFKQEVAEVASKSKREQGPPFVPDKTLHEHDEPAREKGTRISDSAAVDKAPVKESVQPEPSDKNEQNHTSSHPSRGHRDESEE